MKLHINLIACFFCCLLINACNSPSSKPEVPPTPSKQISTPKPAAVAAAATPPDAAQVQAAIDKALAYTLKSSDKKIDPNAALLLHFLNRKFNLGKQYAFSNFYTKYPITDPRGKALERMVNPNATATPADFGSRYQGTSIVDQLANTSYMMNCALMCDKVPLPNDYFTLLQQQTRLDRYFLTHAALSLQWLQENGCITNPTQAKQLKNEQAELLSKLIVSVDEPSDLGMEAIAVLLYIGAKDKLDPNRISGLLKTQLPDGGWPLGKSSAKQSHDHATVHALWALLEFANPNAPATSWVIKK